MGRKSVLIQLGAGLLLLASQLPANPPLVPPFSSMECRDQIKSTLDRWEEHRRWTWDYGMQANIFRSPTAQIGNWIEVRVPRNGGGATVSYLTPTEVTTVAWLPGSCERQVSSTELHYNAERMGQAFTDLYLAALVKRYPAGIVYAWSPHMPLSLKGAWEVKKAAARLKLRVFLVLDPHADSRTAEYVVRAYHFDPSALRRMESFELFNRGMPNHYPSIVVFNHGKIVGPMIPGLKEESGYVKLIAEQLR